MILDAWLWETPPTDPRFYPLNAERIFGLAPQGQPA
jgi:hypothetical protein